MRYPLTSSASSGSALNGIVVRLQARPTCMLTSRSAAAGRRRRLGRRARRRAARRARACGSRPRPRRRPRRAAPRPPRARCRRRRARARVAPGGSTAARRAARARRCCRRAIRPSARSVSVLAAPIARARRGRLVGERERRLLVRDRHVRADEAGAPAARARSRRTARAGPAAAGSASRSGRARRSAASCIAGERLWRDRPAEHAADGISAPLSTSSATCRRPRRARRCSAATSCWNCASVDEKACSPHVARLDDVVEVGDVRRVRRRLDRGEPGVADRRRRQARVSARVVRRVGCQLRTRFSGCVQLFSAKRIVASMPSGMPSLQAVVDDRRDERALARAPAPRARPSRRSSARRRRVRFLLPRVSQVDAREVLLERRRAARRRAVCAVAPRLSS